VKRITFLAVAVLLAVGVSQAAVEVNLTSTSPGGGGSTLFTYDLDIGTNTTWRTNDFLVLYDFGPVMQAFSVLPAMLAFGAVQNTGPTAPAQVPNDSSGVLNVQIINVGPPIMGAAFSGATDFTFSLASPLTGIATNNMLNISTQYFDNAGGTGVAGDTSNVPVPGPGPGDNPVPEPGTMSLIGCALAGAAMLVHRKK